MDDQKTIMVGKEEGGVSIFTINSSGLLKTKTFTESHSFQYQSTPYSHGPRKYSVSQVLLSPYQNFLCVLVSQNGAYIYDAKNNFKPIKHLTESGHELLGYGVFSPSETLFAFRPFAIGGNGANETYVYNIKNSNFALTKILKSADKSRICFIEFSPNNQLFATSEYNGDTTIYTVNPDSTITFSQKLFIPEHSEKCIVFNPTNDFLLVGARGALFLYPIFGNRVSNLLHTIDNYNTRVLRPYFGNNNSDTFFAVQFNKNNQKNCKNNTAGLYQLPNKFVAHPALKTMSLQQVCALYVYLQKQDSPFALKIVKNWCEQNNIDMNTII